ncbi:MAG: 50S ribosomal protein L18 [Candidatus Andersenbacteria bacterium]
MISKSAQKQHTRLARVRRIRSRLVGSASRPRLVASRSNTGMYLQLIDDAKGVTLLAVRDQEFKKKTKTERAAAAATQLAEQALKKGIKQVVFDRAGRAYHGRIAAVAEAARKAGLKF